MSYIISGMFEILSLRVRHLWILLKQLVTLSHTLFTVMNIEILEVMQWIADMLFIIHYEL